MLTAILAIALTLPLLPAIHDRLVFLVALAAAEVPCALGAVYLGVSFLAAAATRR